MEEPVYKDVCPEERTHIGYEHMIADDSEAWFFNGNYHRVGAPAYISNEGHKEYFVYGIHERMDGPAIDGPRYQIWYLDGIPIVEPDRVRIRKHLVTCAIEELPPYIGTEFESVVRWRLNGNK